VTDNPASVRVPPFDATCRRGDWRIIATSPAFPDTGVGRIHGIGAILGAVFVPGNTRLVFWHRARDPASQPTNLVFDGIGPGKTQGNCGRGPVEW
jgi:hypothetical protein